VQGGKVVYSQGFGTLEQSGSTPVNSQTLFMIGSTTKSMTTMMAATLVDDGVLNWDTPATDILPDFALSDRAATEKIRVRDLFNMSSGVPRYDIPLALKTFTPQAVQEQIALIPLDSQPGDKYHYSNFMVTLGGYAAAVAAGADLGSADDKYAALMQQRVFQPIGMSATTLDFDGALANANHAVSYSYDSISGQFLPMPMNFARAVTATAPAGGVWSNADDMAKYMMTELSRGIAPDGKRVVSEQNLLETWKPEIDMGGSSQYGMGWMIGSYHGQRLINHGGNIAGFTSDFGFLPDAGLGALVLSNRSIDNNFGASIREYVFESAFGLDHSADAYYSSSETSFKTLFDQLIKESGAKDQPVDPRTVANYVGDYQDGVKIGFPSAGQFAVTTAYGDIPLLPTNSSDHFVSGGALMGNDVVFSEDGKGQVTMTISSLLGVITGETQPYTLKKTG
jgi:CubicO group peptidase (beta-lactamase class C family)